MPILGLTLTGDENVGFLLKHTCEFFREVCGLASILLILVKELFKIFSHRKNNFNIHDKRLLMFNSYQLIEKMYLNKNFKNGQRT